MHLLLDLERMQIGENQLVSAAVGCGGMGTDVTTFVEGMEPSSFAAAIACLSLSTVFQ